MLVRIITLALVLALSWTGFSGQESVRAIGVTDLASDAEVDLAGHSEGSIDEHQLDDTPLRTSADLPDTQDLATLVPHRFPCRGDLPRPRQPDAQSHLPDPWIAQPQRPPRFA